MKDVRRCQLLRSAKVAPRRDATNPFVEPSPVLTADQEARFARKLAAEVRAQRVPRHDMQYARIFSTTEHAVVIREIRYRRARAFAERVAWALVGASSFAALARLFV